MDDRSTPRQQLALRLVNLLGYGLIPMLLFPYLKDYLFPRATLPPILLYGFAVYIGLWFILALAWFLLRHFPSIRFSLRALLGVILTLQIPFSVLFTSKTNSQTQIGVCLLVAWIVGVIVYIYRLAKPAK